MSVAPAILSGVTALVSFLFGLLLDPIGRRVSDLPAALAGLALLMAGIPGIAYACERSYQAERERRESDLLNYTGGSVCETRRDHKSKNPIRQPSKIDLGSLQEFQAKARGIWRFQAGCIEEPRCESSGE